MKEHALIDISVFFKITEEIVPRKGLEELYISIVEISKEILQAEAASLLLYQQTENLLYFKSTTDEGMKKMLGISIPENSGFAWNVFNNKKSIIVNDVNADERFYNGIDLDTGFVTKNILCTPMMARDEFVGVLEIVNKSGRDHFSTLDLKLLEVIATISASSITNRLLYEDLKKRVEELNALYELSRSVALVDNEKDFFMNVVRTLAESLNVERASLILFVPDRKRLEIIAAYGSSVPAGAVIPDDSIAAHVFKTGKMINVSNVKNDLPEYCKKNKEYKTNAFVSVPLYYNNRIAGVLNLTDKKNRRLFDDFELNVLSALISHMTGVYRTFADRRQEEKRKKLKQELDIAADIQRKNLVKIPSGFNGITVSVLYEPAKHVGGDFFDFYEVDDYNCGIMIADVSGKGIPAALFTGTVKNILKFGSKNNHRPAGLFQISNTAIFQESEYGMFVTVFYVLVDTVSNIITFSSAGHNDQILIRRKNLEVVKLQAKGKPFGIITPANYAEKTIIYEKGDVLFLFTDGLVESLGGETLDIDIGFSALSEIIISNIDKTPEEMLNIMRNKIRELYPDQDLLDDLTVLIISL
ncbi:MAG TPA: SpoIIE family protein phosphatase [Spirochaetota bacterium]|nr:SpoIIE family protein phosphatase [Spirochaetota bacterium]